MDTAILMTRIASFCERVEEFVSWKRRNDKIPQHVYVVEECSEAGIEFLKTIQTITKAIRGKTEKDELANELCDVIATALVHLRLLGCSPEDIMDRIEFKMNRAMGIEDHHERKSCSDDYCSI